MSALLVDREYLLLIKHAITVLVELGKLKLQALAGCIVKARGWCLHGMTERLIASDERCLRMKQTKLG